MFSFLSSCRPWKSEHRRSSIFCGPCWHNNQFGRLVARSSGRSFARSLGFFCFSFQISSWGRVITMPLHHGLVDEQAKRSDSLALAQLRPLFRRPLPPAPRWSRSSFVSLRVRSRVSRSRARLSAAAWPLVAPGGPGRCSWSLLVALSLSFRLSVVRSRGRSVVGRLAARSFGRPSFSRWSALFGLLVVLSPGRSVVWSLVRSVAGFVVVVVVVVFCFRTRFFVGPSDDNAIAHCTRTGEGIQQPAIVHH